MRSTVIIEHNGFKQGKVVNRLATSRPLHPKTQERTLGKSSLLIAIHVNGSLTPDIFGILSHRMLGGLKSPEITILSPIYKARRQTALLKTRKRGRADDVYSPADH